VVSSWQVASFGLRNQKIQTTKKSKTDDITHIQQAWTANEQPKSKQSFL
jgi:adenosylmethionine-8-amino-7-oxononanoate aminotransferase